MSVDREGHGYRWLLRCADGDVFMLQVRDRRTVRAQARLARRAGQRCFVVVKFGHPGGSAVVVPAAKAMRNGCLSAERAGIPWGS